jgi:methyl-accepting chemotaxis protein
MGRKINIHSISVQLLVLVLIVAIVPVAVLAYNTNNSITSDKYQQFKEKVGDSATLGATVLSAQQDDIHYIAYQLSTDPLLIKALRDGDTAAVKRIAKSYADGDSRISSIAVTNKDAVQIARTGSNVTGDKATEADLLNALDGNAKTGLVVVPANILESEGLAAKARASGTSDGLTISSYVSIRDPDTNNVIGALCVRSLLNGGNVLVDSIGKETGCYCTIFFGDMRVATTLVNDSGSRIVGTKAAAEVSAKVIQNGEVFDNPLTVNKIPMYVNYQPLKDNDGKTLGMLFFGYDIRPGLADLNNLTMTSIGIGVVIAILAAIVGLIIVNRITRPINKLVVAANNVAAGDLNTTFEKGVKGEVGNLTGAIEKMVGNIKERIAFNESVLKGIPDPLYVVDTQGKVTYANDAGAKMIGTSATELVGRKFDDSFGAISDSSKEDHLARCLKTGESFKNFEINARIKAGKNIWVRGNVVPVKDANNKVTGGMELLQDITEAKDAQLKIVQAEKESREKALFSDSVLKAVTDAHLVFDPKGNLTYINEVAQKMLAVSERDVLGRSVEDVLGVSNSNARKALIEQRNVHNTEGRVVARGGREIPVLVNVSLLKDIHGSVTGINAMFKDIANEKAAQEAIEKAEKESREKALFSDSVMKSITDAHMVTDIKGNLVYINEVALRMLGWSERDALGRNIEDVIGVKNSIAMKVLLEQRDAHNMEGHFITRGGRDLPVLVNTTLLKDLKGNVTGINAMFRDITKDKEAKKQLAEITASANRIAERVSGASGNVASSVQQVMSASRQISESIQQIASGSQTQARNIENVNKLMHDMSTSIAVVTDGARKTSEDAVKANIVAKKGSENAKIAIKKMDELHVAVNDSALIVKDLGEKSKKIGQIVEMITAIAGQTNLLALNAAIEAARAGDAGRGFAVVAEEVRKLAEEAAKAAEEINSLIGEVREQTARAVESMNKGTREVDESNRIVAESLKSLEDIGRLVDTTAAKAQEIAAMTEKQAADTQRVVKDVEEIAAVIEQSAAGTEEVGASSEETTSTAEQVSGMAGELAKIAEELKAEVGKLKVE